MARITVEDCLSKETNRFALVLLAAKRTKQLLHGAKVLLDEKCENKPVVTSLREIADGKVRFMTAEEIKEAERREEEERYLSEALSEEGATESVIESTSSMGSVAASDDSDDSDDQSEEESVTKVVDELAGNSSNGESAN